MGRERFRLQAKGLRVLADDGGGEEARDIENAFAAKRLVEFDAISVQGADAALLVLIVDEQF